MSQHIRGLNLVMSALVVSVAALRHQNCEADEDVARVLERAAIDRLDIEIENVAELSRISRDTLERVTAEARENGLRQEPTRRSDEAFRPKTVLTQI